MLAIVQFSRAARATPRCSISLVAASCIRTVTSESKDSTAKPKILIIGSGWAGFRIASDLDKEKYNVSIVSPRNHFLFTPLLPSTAVGTLEFRAIQEPVRTIPGISYFQASVDEVDFDSKTVTCVDSYNKDHKYDLSYDKVVLAPGSESNTFGIRGVEDNPHIFYLKQLEHSRAIRNKLIECFERASSPGCTKEEINALLTFVIVGGGPTNVEFAAELHDFLVSDVSRWYPDLYRDIKVVIVEASGHLLGTFKESLVGYVESLFKRRGIEVMTSVAVASVDGNKATFNNGQTLTFGMMIWSAGNKQVRFINELPESLVAKSRNGRLLVDSHLRVLSKFNQDSKEVLIPAFRGSVYAMGDCAGHHTRPLPALAQVASQQASYLAEVLNKYEHIPAHVGNDTSAGLVIPPFTYTHLGAMASVGSWKGVYDSTNLGTEDHSVSGAPVKGFLAFLLWRAAYWTKQVSISNKILIPMFWFKSYVFGRDISRF